MTHSYARSRTHHASCAYTQNISVSTCMSILMPQDIYFRVHHILSVHNHDIIRVYTMSVSACANTQMPQDVYTCIHIILHVFILCLCLPAHRVCVCVCMCMCVCVYMFIHIYLMSMYVANVYTVLVYV